MGRRWGRVVALAAVVPLAACSATGDLWFAADDTVRVELDVSYPYSTPMFMPLCSPTDWLGTGTLKADRKPAPSGHAACHLSGTVSRADATQGPWGIFGRAVFSDDFAFLQVPGYYLQSLGAGVSADLDLTLHFPGEVVAIGGAGRAQGTTVHIADADALAEEGLSLTARLAPTEPDWVVPGVAGLGWGAALAGLVWWLRRRTPPAEEAPHPAPVPAPAVAHDPSPEPRTHADATDWAPDA